MAPKERSNRWTLYVDESGKFADVEDDTAMAGLLVSEEVPGLSLREVRKSLEYAVPGFPWPWHASLINNASWVALTLANRALPANPADPDIRWLGDAVRRANTVFEARLPVEYSAIRHRLALGGDIRLESVSAFESVLRAECPSELQALRAHALRARAAVRQFSIGLRKRAESALDEAAACLLFASETVLGDARSEPESALGDRRYFKLLEVLVDRAAALLARRGQEQVLFLDISERHLIDLRFQSKAKQIPLYVQAELSQLIERWRSTVRIVVAAVTPFGPDVGMQFVVVDFAANYGRLVLRNGPASLGEIEAGIQADRGLLARSGIPTRSHVAASGEAYNLVTKAPHAEPDKSLPVVGLRRRWACEQAWEWSRE